MIGGPRWLFSWAWGGIHCGGRAEVRGRGREGAAVGARVRGGGEQGQALARATHALRPRRGTAP